MHGFNRLGGNSVAETVVAGMIVGEFVADFCDDAGNDASIPTALVREVVAAEQGRLEAMARAGGNESGDALKAAMQQIMTDKVGIFREGPKLEQAVAELQALLKRSRNIRVGSAGPGPNPELVTAYRTQKMIKLALTIAYGAFVRTESRGAHFRQDHPRRNDAEWLKRTLAWWKSPGDDLPTLTYEPLDVSRMELPPGWRGYGAKDYIDHPDTPARAEAVAGLRASLAGQDRFAVQEALMSFRHLLPDRYRGRNERIDEPLGTTTKAA
jgi:fumarate reductase flavoprotein subunit